MWDRNKQTYWVARSTRSVMRISDGKKLCDFPYKCCFYDMNLLKSICFADNDEVVINILKDTDNVNSTCSLQR